MIDAHGFTKASQFMATTHADVLTGIDQLTGTGVGEGPRPTTESIARFEYGDGVTSRSQCRSSS